MTDKTKEIIESNTLDIHGKSYLTVAGRLQLLHEDAKRFDIVTEVLQHSPVVVKATLSVRNDDGLALKSTTGISAANPGKTIERMTPYEVAETSAVGRALGFAGYGLIDSVASADEMHKAGVGTPPPALTYPLRTNNHDLLSAKDKADIDDVMSGNTETPPWDKLTCDTCGADAVHKTGTSAKGKPWEALFCSTGEKSHAKFL